LVDINENKEQEFKNIAGNLSEKHFRGLIIKIHHGL